jgi:hypothetical protein
MSTFFLLGVEKKQRERTDDAYADEELRLLDEVKSFCRSQKFLCSFVGHQNCRTAGGGTTSSRLKRAVK